jgi:hypothetical protein
MAFGVSCWPVNWTARERDTPRVAESGPLPLGGEPPFLGPAG